MHHATDAPDLNPAALPGKKYASSEVREQAAGPPRAQFAGEYIIADARMPDSRNRMPWFFSSISGVLFPQPPPGYHPHPVIASSPA